MPPYSKMFCRSGFQQRTEAIVSVPGHCENPKTAGAVSDRIIEAACLVCVFPLQWASGGVPESGSHVSDSGTASGAAETPAFAIRCFLTTFRAD